MNLEKEFTDTPYHDLHQYRQLMHRQCKSFQQQKMLIEQRSKNHKVRPSDAERLFFLSQRILEIENELREFDQRNRQDFNEIGRSAWYD